MKRRVIWALAMAYFVGVHVVLLFALARPGWVERQHWRFGVSTPEDAMFAERLHAYHQAIDETARPGRIVLIGDSHFQRMDANLIGLPALNFGIGGARVPDMAARIKDLGSVRDATAVVIWGGVNDLIAERAPDAVARDMGRMVAAFPDRAPVLLLSVPPPGGDFPDHDLAGRTADLNRQYRALCDASPGCRYVDAAALVADKNGLLSPSFDAGDHLHLNAAAYEEIADALARALDEAER
jgi:lysophospholipase L1-like esterase